MYIELHLIQNFVPANLNRDDTNNPKDYEFGGVRRARISSQCIKRAIRNSPVFAETTRVEVGKRTRWITRLLSKALVAAGKPEKEAGEVAVRFAEAYTQKMDGKEKAKTAIQVYVSPEELQEVAATLVQNWAIVLQQPAEADKLMAGLVKQLLTQYEITSAPDVALFGRMLAIKPTTQILDAACQVAHAISTHRVTMEMDFFTAVDDVVQGEETGAGMMGFTGYNSACFYRYARLDWEQLVKNLGADSDLALRTVEGFLRAAVEAIPTGKQTGFAAQNPPSFLLAVVRSGGAAWSLANAFEKPVRAERDSGLVAPSVKALDAYWGRLSAVYGTKFIKAKAAVALDDGLALDALKGAQVKDLDAWVEATLKPIKEATA
ncbi:MAG: type I-E CRISPR-associated protein Cas7/Cse4/CasC [Chloroflexi bacterium]|nr:type I-E CRISPR-associated protein Cas7/Cse4/CasC [Chloroflexota bacterium]